MNKFVKYALIGYGTMILAKGIEFAMAQRNFKGQAIETVEGHPVFHEHAIIKSFGLKVAAAAPLNNGTKAILVDDHFIAMPEYVREAILAHEAGHIELGHLDNITAGNNMKRGLIALAGGVQDIELEADRYAADKVGTKQMIEALQYLSMIPRVNKRELHRRIAALQN